VLPRASRIALLAAAAAALAWALKALVIWNAGGLDESSLEAPLFVLGLVAILISAAALAIVWAAPRPLWQLVAAGVAGIVAGFVVGLALGNLLAALLPESAGWVREEAGLWLTAAAVLALALARNRRLRAAEA